MRRAGSFARRSTGVVAVDAVVIPVILIPLFRPPLYRIRQFLLRVDHRALLRAELLAELHRPGGAVFHTAAAGDAILRINARHIGRTGKVRRVKQLRGAQGIADIHVAVADRKDLILAVNIRNLVDKAVILRTFEDLHHFIIIDIMALVGFHQIIGHVAYADTPILRIIRAALA